MSNCECMAKENLPVSSSLYCISSPYIGHFICLSFHSFILSWTKILKIGLQVWTETAKKQECMRNILYVYLVQFSAKIPDVLIFYFFLPNHLIIRCYRASLLHVWVTAALFVLFAHLYIIFKCLYLLFRLPFLYIKLYNLTVQAFLMVSSNHNVLKSAIVC